jgi:hypothetical protein
MQKKSLKQQAAEKGISISQLKFQTKLKKDQEATEAARRQLNNPDPWANKGWNPRAGSKGVRHRETDE